MRHWSHAVSGFRRISSKTVLWLLQPRRAIPFSLRLKQAQGRYDEIPLCKDCNRKNLNVSRAVAGVGSALGDPGLVLRSLSPLSRLGIRP